MGQDGTKAAHNAATQAAYNKGRLDERAARARKDRPKSIINENLLIHSITGFEFVTTEAVLMDLGLVRAQLPPGEFGRRMKALGWRYVRQRVEGRRLWGWTKRPAIRSDLEPTM